MEPGPSDLLVPSATKRWIAKPGDFFTFRLGSGETLLGRVAATKARMLSCTGAMKVIYIYPPGTPFDPPPPYLPVSSIWIGPFIVWPEGWSMKYFARVLNRPFLPGERLTNHVFWSGKVGEYYDEHGDRYTGPLPERMGIASVKTIQGIAGAIMETRAGLPDLSTPPAEP